MEDRCPPLNTHFAKRETGGFVQRRTGVCKGDKAERETQGKKEGRGEGDEGHTLSLSIVSKTYILPPPREPYIYRFKRGITISEAGLVPT